MHSLKYRITSQSPLVISTISGDMNMVKTERFIPGTTVLGVLASRFIEKRKGELNGKPAHQDDAFYNWFLSGNLKISNAYVFSRDEYGGYTHYPTPFSIEQEKYGETVYDRLLDLDITEQTAYVGGFCFLDGESIQIRSVETGVSFHHARDPEKGVSQEGRIFNYESISKDQIFEGSIFGEESDLRNFLNICGSQWTAFVGRSRNAQYGAVKFEILDQEPVLVESPEPEDEEGKPDKCISMTLLSNMILYNEHGYPTVDISDLQKELEKYLRKVEIEKAFVKKTEVENFVSIWQLKKPSETCFAAGSTFLLRVNQNELKQLVKIQENGIGERTHEGFGRCVFGIQTNPKPILRDEAKEEATRMAVKPDKPIPQIARDAIISIIKEIIAEKINLEAMNKQEEFVRLPSNALIARMEGMAKNTRNRNEFVGKINKLRTIALDQLKYCVSREFNLLEFLAAFRLDEDSIISLAREEIDQQLLDKLRQLQGNRQFVLILELEKAVNRDLNASEKSVLLKHVRFCQNPVDWQKFFKDPKNAEIKSLCEEIGFHPEEDEELIRELSKSFLTTFFSMMRKRTVAE